MIPSLPALRVSRVRILVLLPFLLGWVLSARRVHGEFPAQSMIAAITTSEPGPDNRAWVFVAWSPATPEVLRGRTFAIYGRPGGPESIAPFERWALVGGNPGEPSALALAMQRGRELGADPAELASVLDTLIADAPVQAAPTPEAKLAASLRLAETQAEVGRSLDWVGRRFPMVDLARGRAWAERRGVGPATVEVRDFDRFVGRDRFVVARFIVEVGVPESLPQPGPPITVGSATGQEDLRVGLVWAEPEALRRRAPLVSGYEVWRLPAERARASGWERRSPDYPELLAIPGAERIQALPLIPGRSYSVEEALQAASDPAAAFVWDGGPDGGGWKDGDEYAWLVVARDLLGQPGRPSTAGWGRVCGRRAPAMPRNLEGAMNFAASPGVSGARVELRWDAPSGDEPVPTRYEIYRGMGDLPPVASTNELPSSFRVGTLPAAPGLAPRLWRDPQLDPSSNPALYGRSIWYAIRAVRDGPCGSVPSPVCPPCVVNLRRLDAPEAPTGELGIHCAQVEVRDSGVPPGREPAGPGVMPARHFRMILRRRDAGVAWVEVTAVAGDPAWARVESPQMRYGEGDTELVFDFDLPATGGSGPMRASVVAGAFSGATSGPWTVSLLSDLPVELRHLLTVEAGTLSDAVAMRHPGETRTCAHVARPADSRAVVPIRVRLVLPERAAEWRVYRSVDDGPVTLIAEGIGNPPGQPPRTFVEASDDAMPSAGARLCYFGQVSDEHGNWSPMGPLGCEDVLPGSLPKPLLAKPESEGTRDRPVMRLRWFCAPPGVQRFRVVMEPKAGDFPVQGVSAGVARAKPILWGSPKPVMWAGGSVDGAGRRMLRVTSMIETGPVAAEPLGVALGEGPDFEFAVDVDPRVEYEIRVVPVDARGNAGYGSDARRFTWTDPNPLAAGEVPWPSRPLPAVVSHHPGLGAVLLQGETLIWPGTGAATPVGVRIGRIPLGLRETREDLLRSGWGENGGRLLRTQALRSAVMAGSGLDLFLFEDSRSRGRDRSIRVLPAVLYRQQVTNAEYSEVSGAVVQVSTLVRGVAAHVLADQGGVEFLDPMMGLTLATGNGAGDPGSVEVHVLDLHPVVAGARYRYWLVHFDDRGEPDRTFPAGDVEVPR